MYQNETHTLEIIEPSFENDLLMTIFGLTMVIEIALDLRVVWNSNEDNLIFGSHNQFYKWKREVVDSRLDLSRSNGNLVKVFLQ